MSTEAQPDKVEKEALGGTKKPISFEKTETFTLPVNSITEYIFKEELESTEVHRDVYGNIVECIPIVKRKKIGMFVAYPDETQKVIMIGWSKCNTKEDTFTSFDAARCAVERAKQYLMLPKKEGKEIPEDILPQFNRFLKRCRLYFDQLMEKEWTTNFHVTRVLQNTNECISPLTVKNSVSLRETVENIFFGFNGKIPFPVESNRTYIIKSDEDIVRVKNILKRYGFGDLGGEFAVGTIINISKEHTQLWNELIGNSK